MCGKACTRRWAWAVAVSISVMEGGRARRCGRALLASTGAGLNGRRRVAIHTLTSAHPRESGDPGSRKALDPAFAGMSGVSKRLEGDHGACVEDAREGLHLLRHEMADIEFGIEVEFGDDVVIAGGRIDLGGDL